MAPESHSQPMMSLAVGTHTRQRGVLPVAHETLSPVGSTRAIESCQRHPRRRDLPAAEEPPRPASGTRAFESHLRHPSSPASSRGDIKSRQQLTGHRVPAAALEASRHEPAVPGAARSSRREDTCPICLGPLEDPAGVDPCRHAFCHACIQRWAATALAATCPLCRQPIAAIRRLRLDDDRGRVARSPHGRFHPYAGPWRWGWQRQQRQRHPGGPRRRSLSAERGERSPPVPRQRVRSLSWQWDSDGRSRLRSPPETREDPSWLRRVREEEPGAGDHAHHLPWLHP
ncbi:E3 ubiquitin-protein ligase Topors-like [Grus japonensis]|uniref:RING-type E3 ubiquitin transferase n=1 Tax=Grus japonensis TaxID=30415 RepID=A0ABC9YBL5_GRUJA